VERNGEEGRCHDDLEEENGRGSPSVLKPSPDLVRLFILEPTKKLGGAVCVGIKNARSVGLWTLDFGLWSLEGGWKAGESGQYSKTGSPHEQHNFGDVDARDFLGVRERKS